MKVGLYFGSFNPPHIGHTAIAEYMMHHMLADEVWMVVSPQNPFKEKEGLLPEEVRLNLVKRALNGNSSIKACNFEFDLPRPSYTVDTMKAMVEKHPDEDFFIIMGSDNLLKIKDWKDYEALLSQFEIAVYPRPGYELTVEFVKSLGGNIRISEAPIMEISSTSIRQAIHAGIPCEFLMRSSVWRSIEREGYYS